MEIPNADWTIGQTTWQLQRLYEISFNDKWVSLINTVVFSETLKISKRSWSEGKGTFLIALYHCHTQLMISFPSVKVFTMPFFFLTWCNLSTISSFTIIQNNTTLIMILTQPFIKTLKGSVRVCIIQWCNDLELWSCDWKLTFHFTY